jgi:hypothetical protein
VEVVASTVRMVGLVQRSKDRQETTRRLRRNNFNVRDDIGSPARNQCSLA